MGWEAFLAEDPTNPMERNARLQREQDEAMLRDLVAFRERRGLTQQDVADSLGVSQSAIARFETRERNPNLRTLRRYAIAVGAVTEHTVRSLEAHERHLDDTASQFGGSALIQAAWGSHHAETPRRPMSLGIAHA